MTATDIARRLDVARQAIRRDPAAATQSDAGVTATIEAGLRVSVTDDAGRILATDMPAVIGGSGSAATPGTLLRAAVASCEATILAMVAAEEGIPLTHVDVRVESRSDYRGLLGIDDDGQAVFPGPLELVIRLRIVAPGVDPEQVRALVARCEDRSPVTAALRLSVPVRTEIDVVAGGEIDP
jgi:uncharacterized OsmC-like protein